MQYNQKSEDLKLIVSALKSTLTNYQTKRAHLHKLFAILHFEQTNQPLHVFLETQKLQPQTKLIPFQIQILLHHSKSWLQDVNICHAHLISLEFLLKIYKCGYLDQYQSQQITNVLISAAQKFKGDEENLQHQSQLMIKILEWIQFWLRSSHYLLQSNLVNHLIKEGQVEHKEIQHLIQSKLYNQTIFIQKVVFFVKHYSSTAYSHKIFNNLVNILELCTRKVFFAGQSLRNLVVIRSNQTRILQLYQNIKQLQKTKSNKQERYIRIILYQLKQIQRLNTNQLQLFRAQKLLRACKLHQTLINILSAHCQNSQYIFEILSIFAEDSVQNSQIILQYLHTNKIDIFKGNIQQFTLISKISDTQIFSVPDYFYFVEGFIKTKKYNPNDNNHTFMDALLSLSTSVSQHKILKLISSSTILKNILNIPHDKQLSGNNDLKYTNDCLQFLINIHPPYFSEFSPIVYECLDLIKLFNVPLLQQRNFFVAPSFQTLRSLKFQSSIYKLAYIYNFYKLLNAQDLNLIIMESLHYHSLMLRSITAEKYQQSLKFLEDQGLFVNENDILEYCYQYLFYLLSVAIYQIQDQQLNQKIRSSQKVLASQLAQNISGLLQVYMTQNEYQQRANKSNRLIRLLKAYFKVQPHLEYYWNLGQKQKQNHLIQNQTLFKKQKSYFQKFQIERLLLQYCYSQQFTSLLERQKIYQKQQIQKTVFKNQGTYLHHLFVLLSEGSLQQKELACRILINILHLQNDKIPILMIQNDFVAIFFKQLFLNKFFIRYLFQASFQLLQSNKGSIYNYVACQFQKQFMKSEHFNDILQIFKHYLQNLLEIQTSQNSFQLQFQRTVKFKQNHPDNKHLQIGVYIIVFLQYLCVSLNQSFVAKLSYSTAKSKSILYFLVQILKTLTNNLEMMSLYKYKLIFQCMKVIKIILRSDSINIKRSLYYGYHKVLLSILQIDDSLTTIIENITKKKMTSHRFKKSYLCYLREGQQNLYKQTLQKQLTFRQSLYSLQQISFLKNKATLQIVQMMSQLNSNTLAMVQEVIKLNLISYVEKAQYTYGPTSEDFQKLAFSAKISNLFQGVSQISENSISRYVKESLKVQFGTNLFIFLQKYEDLNGVSIIKNQVYNHLNFLRLKNKYNKKGGIFYQMYSLVKDILMILLNSIRYFCKFRFQQNEIKTDKRDYCTDQHRYLKGIQFFVKNIATIDIKINQNIVNISFPLALQQRSITKSIRRNLTSKINYSSTPERLQTFMQEVHLTLIRIKQQRKLMKRTSKNPLLHLLIKNKELWKNLSFTLVIVQNFIIVYQVKIKHQIHQKAFYTVMGIQYLFVSFLFLIFLLEALPLKLAVLKFSNPSQFANKFLDSISCFCYIMLDRTLVFVVLYTTLITLGIFWNIAISLLLIDFFYRFKKTRFLLLMMIQVWKSIFTNVFFFIVLMYLIIIFFGNMETQQLFGIYCYTYAQCLQMSFHTIYRILGDQYVIKNKITMDFLEVMNTSITIILILAFRGLFIGIIIDQKRKNRANKLQIQKQIKKKCFICGQTQESINTKSGMQKGFKKHVEVQHNLWNYIYYLCYLTELDPAKVTSEQQIVLDSIKSKSFDWIPITRH